MTAATSPLAFNENPAGFERERTADGFVVDLDGFEGPLDLLLSLARRQRVDLRRLSILRLADQYCAFVASLDRADFGIAAECLVMAAWLALLKSRLLLPEPPPAEEAQSAEEMAEALALRLRRLDAIRAVAALLMAQPQWGRDLLPRGCPAPAPPPPAPLVRAELFDLLQAYGRCVRRLDEKAPFTPPPLPLESAEAAIARILAALDDGADWRSFSSLLPQGALDGLRRGDEAARGAVASTLLGCLELAREGALELRQTRAFGPIAARRLAASGRESGGSME